MLQNDVLIYGRLMKQQKFANLPKGQIPFIHWITNPVPHKDYSDKLWVKCVFSYPLCYGLFLLLDKEHWTRPLTR